MTHVFHRHLRQDYPTAVSGQGVYVIDQNGRAYLDASGGAAVSCLGHSDAEVRAAIKSQVDALAYAHSAFFTTEPMEALAEFLAGRSPGDLDTVYFVSGGSESVETALKLARQYYLEIGQPQRRHVIARRQSYHGNTLGALAAGGNAWRRRPFEPLLPQCHHVSPCYAYRDQRSGESDDDYCDRLLKEIEDLILALGPDQVMAFVAEPVVGATLGAVPALPGYFPTVRSLCDRHGILLILDEVMCGMGRTGTLFASEADQVVADLVCVAKGLGGGYQPIGATLVRTPIVEAIRSGSGFFQHGHTYIGHATACAAALAVQRAVDERGLLVRCQRQGQRLDQRLRERLGDHVHVGDIRGRGLFIGLELVADRDHKTPFEPAWQVHAKVRSYAMERGLMCYPMGGTVDGQRGDHVLLAPPFIISGAEIDELVDRLATALDDVFSSLPES